MAAATEQESFTSVVVATGARGIRRMRFVLLTANNGPWFGAISPPSSTASELTSDVRELADETVPQPRRLVAMQRLKGFLHHVAAKVGEVGLGILQTYLEKKLGLS